MWGSTPASNLTELPLSGGRIIMWTGADMHENSHVNVELGDPMLATQAPQALTLADTHIYLQTFTKRPLHQ